jgi:hypothetical protein
VSENGFERDHYLRVVSTNAASARAFAMPDAFLVVYAGQADSARYRFGARVYLLFQTESDYDAWIKEDGRQLLDRLLNRMPVTKEAL